MRYFKLTVAYDGKNYVGWQVQNNGPSVQVALEHAWFKLTGEKRRITASGRTDSGVHAEAQVCSVRTESNLASSVFVKGLNAFLPPDIAVVGAEEMAGNFHAIRDAIGKTYRYQIQSGPVRNVLQRDFWWYVPPQLNVPAMREAAKLLVGQHDFAAFQTTGSDRLTTVRTVTALHLEAREEPPFQWVQIFVSADGFLYNMVRCIAGTLADIGKGKHPPEWCREVLESRDRTRSGPTAPPHGLCLISVDYPTHLSQ